MKKLKKTAQKKPSFGSKKNQRTKTEQLKAKNGQPPNNILEIGEITKKTDMVLRYMTIRTNTKDIGKMIYETGKVLIGYA